MFLYNLDEFENSYLALIFLTLYVKGTFIIFTFSISSKMDCMLYIFIDTIHELVVVEHKNWSDGEALGCRGNPVLRTVITLLRSFCSKPCWQGMVFDLEKGSTLYIDLAKSNSRSKRSRQGLAQIGFSFSVLCIYLYFFLKMD